MSTHDIQGREYARVDQVKAGDLYQVDGDFGCMKPWSTQVVRIDRDGLYLRCCGPERGEYERFSLTDWIRAKFRRHRHHLDSQVNDEGTHFVGVYPADV